MVKQYSSALTPLSHIGLHAEIPATVNVPCLTHPDRPVLD